MTLQFKKNLFKESTLENFSYFCTTFFSEDCRLLANYHFLNNKFSEQYVKN